LGLFLTSHSSRGFYEVKNSLIYKILAELINTYNRVMRKIYKYMLKLAFVVRDHYCDKRLGVETSECYFYPSNNSASVCKDMHIHRPTPYDKLRKILDYLKLRQDDVFVDIGCGKGRAIFFAATRKLKKIIGVELDERLIDIAKKNSEKARFNNTPIEIVHADAAVFDVKEGTVFFMFNPFGPNTVKRVIDNIKKSLTVNPRTIHIVYYNPEYKYLLDTEDWLVLDSRMDDEEISIWRNRDSICR